MFMATEVILDAAGRRDLEKYGLSPLLYEPIYTYHNLIRAEQLGHTKSQYVKCPANRVIKCFDYIDLFVIHAKELEENGGFGIADLQLNKLMNRCAHTLPDAGLRELVIRSTPDTENCYAAPGFHSNRDIMFNFQSTPMPFVLTKISSDECGKLFGKGLGHWMIDRTHVEDPGTTISWPEIPTTNPQLNYKISRKYEIRTDEFGEESCELVTRYLGKEVVAPFFNYPQVDEPNMDDDPYRWGDVKWWGRKIFAGKVADCPTDELLIEDIFPSIIESFDFTHVSHSPEYKKPRFLDNPWMTLPAWSAGLTNILSLDSFFTEGEKHGEYVYIRSDANSFNICIKSVSSRSSDGGLWTFKVDHLGRPRETLEDMEVVTESECRSIFKDSESLWHLGKPVSAERRLTTWTQMFQKGDTSRKKPLGEE
jgi:hypothetical protein